MTAAELGQWVDANPTRVTDWDAAGDTVLYVAACRNDMALVLWLLDEKGAIVNNKTYWGQTPLCVALSLDMLNALLNRGADSIVLNRKNQSPLMLYAYYGTVHTMARLLQDPCVRATIDTQDNHGNTALHFACRGGGGDAWTYIIVHLLLLAGANPLVIAIDGKTPMAVLRERYHPMYETVALLEQALADAEVSSLLVKARRLVVASTSNAKRSCLEGRMARGESLPRVELRKLALQRTLTGGLSEEAKKWYNFRSMIVFLLEMGGGPKGEGMPRDVFRGLLMDLLMPVWDPLRRSVAMPDSHSVAD
jgi:hypothetical protein